MRRFLQIFSIPDLRTKVFIVLGLLVAFRLLAAIPIPGVDHEALRAFFGQNQFFGFLNIFAGGGLSNLSVAMLGVGPYITATIIMQLLTLIFPNLKEMYYENGERGRAKFNQFSRFLTVPLAFLQAYGFLSILKTQRVLPELATFDLVMNVITITAGSMIVLWIGELINEQKIGNGVSLVIFAGIVSSLPSMIGQAWAAYTPSLLPVYLAFVAVVVAVVAGIVYLNEGERKVPVTYARRVRGNKLYGGVSSYLPLKVNQAGMIPLIFAISVLLFPQFIAQVSSIVSPDLSVKLTELVNRYLLNNQLIYGVLYFFLVFLFTYFYTAITFDPKEISKNLQRSGGFIPGIRPGENTSDFFAKTIRRLTLLGAFFLGVVAVLPIIVQQLTNVAVLNVSGTAILIVVAVALETMRQIDSQLTVREYEGIQ